MNCRPTIYFDFPLKNINYALKSHNQTETILSRRKIYYEIIWVASDKLNFG